MALSGDSVLALSKSYTRKTVEGMGVVKGQDGFSPTIVENSNNTTDNYRLEITTADDSFITPNLLGKNGKDGISPSIKENPENTEEVYQLNITDINGTFLTPNLKGKGGNISFYKQVSNLVNPVDWKEGIYFVDYGSSPRIRTGAGYWGIQIPVKAGHCYSSNGYLNKNFSYFERNYSENSRIKLSTLPQAVEGVNSNFIGISNFVPDVDGYLTITSNNDQHNILSVIEYWNQPLCFTEYGEAYAVYLGGLSLRPEMDIYVSPDGTKGFSRIKDALNYVHSKPFVRFTVYVEAGVYDLVQEFVEDYPAYQGTTKNWGLRLNNNVHIIFSSNALVKCHYQGDDYNIRHHFSPFISAVPENGGFELENLNLECSNVRYAIHDETNGQNAFYRNVYKNCRIVLNNSENPDGFPVCIGGGLGSNSEIVIENCYFESIHNDTSRDIVSYHNGGNGRSSIVVTGCYFAGKDTIRCSHYGTSTKKSVMTVSGCRLGSSPILNFESQSHSVENMELVSFGNEISG